MSSDGREKEIERESWGGGGEEGEEGMVAVSLFVPLFTPAKGKQNFVVEIYMVT